LSGWLFTFRNTQLRRPDLGDQILGSSPDLRFPQGRGSSVPGTASRHGAVDWRLNALCRHWRSRSGQAGPFAVFWPFAPYGPNPRRRGHPTGSKLRPWRFISRGYIGRTATCAIADGISRNTCRRTRSDSNFHNFCAGKRGWGRLRSLIMITVCTRARRLVFAVLALFYLASGVAAVATAAACRCDRPTECEHQHGPPVGSSHGAGHAPCFHHCCHGAGYCLVVVDRTGIVERLGTDVFVDTYSFATSAYISAPPHPPPISA
jgi:hypothetical protein